MSEILQDLGLIPQKKELRTTMDMLKTASDTSSSNDSMKKTDGATKMATKPANFHQSMPATAINGDKQVSLDKIDWTKPVTFHGNKVMPDSTNPNNVENTKALKFIVGEANKGTSWNDAHAAAKKKFPNNTLRQYNTPSSGQRTGQPFRSSGGSGSMGKAPVR